MLIKEGKQGNGFGKTALNLLATYAQKHLHIHCLYANIALENKPSIRVFEACGYQQVGLKKAWNFYEINFTMNIFIKNYFIDVSKETADFTQSFRSWGRALFCF
jgi:diamine N-acetyltransferase